MFSTRKSVLCTALSPGPRGGAHARTADAVPAVAEAQPIADTTIVAETAEVALSNLSPLTRLA